MDYQEGIEESNRLLQEGWTLENLQGLESGPLIRPLGVSRLLNGTTPIEVRTTTNRCWGGVK